MTDKIEEAQSHIAGTKIAEMGIQFAGEFRGIYPEHIIGHMLAVGPMQSYVGLAIKNGHLVPADDVAELREQLATARAEIERLRDGWEEAELRSARHADDASRLRYPDTTGQ